MVGKGRSQRGVKIVGDGRASSSILWEHREALSKVLNAGHAFCRAKPRGCKGHQEGKDGTQGVK